MTLHSFVAILSLVRYAISLIVNIPEYYEDRCPFHTHFVDLHSIYISNRGLSGGRAMF